MTNIVLAVFERHRLLEQTLKSLFDGTERDSFNLTCVDDGSTDFRISKLLDRYCQYSNVTCIRMEKSAHVIARAKNIGVAWSEQTFGRGDWLYLSDSDVYFVPSWLLVMQRCAAISESRRFRLWGGQIHPFHKLSDAKVKSGIHSVHEADVLDGPSWMMKWADWNMYGPLSRECASGPGQSEEYPFCKAILESGCSSGVVQPPVVIHCGLTNSLGKPVPGADQLAANPIKGVLYE